MDDIQDALEGITGARSVILPFLFTFSKIVVI